MEKQPTFILDEPLYCPARGWHTIIMLDRALELQDGSVFCLHGRGYKRFPAEHGIEEVKRVQICAVERKVRALMKDQSRNYRAIPTLHSFGGDLSSQAPAVYMDIVGEEADSIFPRLYTGQARILAERLAEDRRKRKGETTLHYKISNRPGSTTQFVLTSKFSTDQVDPDLHLNIQEMWMACFFQTVQRKQLEKYLQPEELLKEEIGLNIASSLSQTHGQSAVKACGLLKHSSDPLVQQYYQEEIVPQNQRFLSLPAVTTDYGRARSHDGKGSGCW